MMMNVVGFVGSESVTIGCNKEFVDFVVDPIVITCIYSVDFNHCLC